MTRSAGTRSSKESKTARKKAKKISPAKATPDVPVTNTKIGWSSSSDGDGDLPPVPPPLERRASARSRNTKGHDDNLPSARHVARRPSDPSSKKRARLPTSAVMDILQAVPTMKRARQDRLPPGPPEGHPTSSGSNHLARRDSTEVAQLLTAANVKSASTPFNCADGDCGYSADSTPMIPPAAGANDRRPVRTLADFVSALNPNALNQPSEYDMRTWLTSIGKPIDPVGKGIAAPPVTNILRSLLLPTPSRQASIARDRGVGAQLVANNLQAKQLPMLSQGQGKRVDEPAYPTPGSREDGGHPTPRKMAYALDDIPSRIPEMPGWFSPMDGLKDTELALIGRARLRMAIPHGIATHPTQSNPILAQSPGNVEPESLTDSFFRQVAKSMRDATNGSGLKDAKMRAATSGTEVSADDFEYLRDRKAWWSTNFIHSLCLAALQSAAIVERRQNAAVAYIPHLIRWDDHSRLPVTAYAGTPWSALGKDASWRQRITVGVVPVQFETHFVTVIIYGPQRLVCPVDGAGGAYDHKLIKSVRGMITPRIAVFR